MPTVCGVRLNVIDYQLLTPSIDKPVFQRVIPMFITLTEDPYAVLCLIPFLTFLTRPLKTCHKSIIC